MNVELTDVLYIPNLEDNLISVKKLTEKVLDVLFTGNLCKLIVNNQMLTIGSCNDGLYKLFKAEDKKSYTAVDNKGKCIHE